MKEKTREKRQSNEKKEAHTIIKIRGIKKEWQPQSSENQRNLLNRCIHIQNTHTRLRERINSGCRKKRKIIGTNLRKQ